jgi:hypothetical protein
VLCTRLAKGRAFRIESCARWPEPLRDVASAGERALARWRWPRDEVRRALEQSRVDVVESDDAGLYASESTRRSRLTYSSPRAGRARPSFAGFLHVPLESSDYPIERIAAAVMREVDARRVALHLDASDGVELEMRPHSGLANRR